MSRRETLRHFELACGVLPEESADQPLVAEEKPLDFIPGSLSDGDLGTIPEEDVAELPLNDLLPYSGGYADGGPSPSENGPPMYYPTFGGVGWGGGMGPTPPISRTPPTSPGAPQQTSSVPPGTPQQTSSVPPVVPEPSSYVLMLTGMVAAAGMVRRRFIR